MISLQIFFVFEVEVLKVLGGFKAWFQQSFCTSESWCLPRCVGFLVCVCVCWNALGRLLFMRVWGWISDTWWSFIGDMCHSLVGEVLRLFLQGTWHFLISRNVLIFKVTHVSTRLDLLHHRLHMSGCLCHCLHVSMCDFFFFFACILCPYFNDTWQISVGFWIVIAKLSSSTWHFVIGHTLQTW